MLLLSSYQYSQLTTDRVAAAVAVLDVVAEALTVDNVREPIRRISIDTTGNMRNITTSWKLFRRVNRQSSGTHFDEIYQTASGLPVLKRALNSAPVRSCIDIDCI